MAKNKALLNTFGKRLRSLREGKDLYQTQLARLTGLDRTYIGGIERGERNVSIENIAKLAKALGMPMRDLFNGVG